jgi:hypothetical protein
VTEQPFRFCPRCGTALVEGMPYCPKCGFNLEDLSRPAVRPSADATSRGDDRRDAPAPRRSTAPLIGAALIVAVGLIGYAVLTRPAPAAQQGGGGPAQGSLASLAPGVTAPPSAPIVGLTIVSPRDGDVVSTEEVTVIGVAPPGLRITRDVSLFPDQHATVDGTGHWAIAVRLDQGDNTLVFRIGDDRSTEQRIRVTYTRPAT